MKIKTKVMIGAAALLGAGVVGAGVFLRKRGEVTTPPGEATQPELDNVRHFAEEWILERAGKITLEDAIAHVAVIRRDYIPVVLDEWRRHGMSVDFLRELGDRFMPQAVEDQPMEAT